MAEALLDEQPKDSETLFQYTGENASEIQRTNATLVTISSSIAEIEAEAFRDCRKLAEVDFSKGNVQIIGARVFLYCHSIKRLNIPSTVKEIGDAAFARCALLTELNLPDGIRIIPNTALGHCANLRSVRIPLTVTEIRNFAFTHCQRLVSLQLPRSLEILGEQVFTHCKSLTNIWIPPKIKVIKNRTFMLCTSLISIELPGTLETIETMAFRFCKDLRLIQVPPSCSFTGAGGDHAFEGCNKLLEVMGDWYFAEFTQRRFSKQLNLHNLCYYQSYRQEQVTTTDLQKASMETNDSSACDSFEMTPFHILSMSASPNLDLCRMLVQRFPSQLVARDRWRRNALFYCCKNLAPGAGEMLQFLTRSLLGNIIDGLGLEQWRVNVLNEIASLATDSDFPERFEHLDHVASILSMYIAKEKLSLLEMAIWKLRIDQEPWADGGIVDREACRMTCGFDIIVTNVLPFLGPEPKLDGLVFEDIQE